MVSKDITLAKLALKLLLRRLDEQAAQDPAKAAAFKEFRKLSVGKGKPS